MHSMSKLHLFFTDVNFFSGRGDAAGGRGDYQGGGRGGGGGKLIKRTLYSLEHISCTQLS